MSEELLQRQADDAPALVVMRVHSFTRVVFAGRSHPPTAHCATPMHRWTGSGTAASSAREMPSATARGRSQPAQSPLPDRPSYGSREPGTLFSRAADDRPSTNVALGRGTVVIEAAERRGTLATARHASNLTRRLMAVPGPVTSATSAGCVALIRDQHAACTTSATSPWRSSRPAPPPDLGPAGSEPVRSCGTLRPAPKLSAHPCTYSRKARYLHDGASGSAPRSHGAAPAVRLSSTPHAGRAASGSR